MKKIQIYISDISKRAGTERAVCNLANLLTTYGNYSVEIVSIETNNTKSPAYELSKKVNVINLNLSYSKNLFFRLFRHFLTLHLIKKTSSGSDFIIGTEYYINYLFCFLRKSLIKIGCEHTNYDKPGLHHKLLRRIFYPKLNAVVMLTENDTKRYTFLKNKYTIPNSLSFETSKYANFQSKTFLAVGRLNYQKGFDMLINIAKNIKKELPDWKIEIYGDGEDKTKLLEQIENNHLQDYVFIKSPTTNIVDVYTNSSIYLLSSRFEGFPMVLLENQACGVPTISFNCPEGPSEIIENGINGYLIDMFDLDDFAQKAIYVAKNESLWNSMSQQSIIHSKKYIPENIYLLWDELFQNL